MKKKPMNIFNIKKEEILKDVKKSNERNPMSRWIK
jgi:hypothetical protein